MKWARVQSVLWRSAPGYLVLSAQDGTATEIGGPGGEVWRLLDQPNDEDALITQLTDLYAAERSLIETDVHRLLLELETAGYVRRVH